MQRLISVELWRERWFNLDSGQVIELKLEDVIRVQGIGERKILKEAMDVFQFSRA